MNDVKSAGAGCLVLSPHSDDAALTLGGLLYKHILPSPVTLVTIFGRSSYLKASAFQSDWVSTTSLRRKEDIVFARSVGAELLFMDFPDAGLRIGPSFQQIFSEATVSDAPLPKGLIGELHLLLADLNPQFLLAPLGIGRHHDHLLVRELAKGLSLSNGLGLIFYEDLPYASELPEEEVIKHALSVEPQLIPVLVPIRSELGKKVEGLLLYESQIGEEEITAVKEYAFRWDSKSPMERLWSVVPSSHFIP